MFYAFARPVALFGLLLSLATAGRSQPAPPPALHSPWQPVESDLPVDPQLRDVTLRNGVRVLILPNAEPKGQVSMRLVVGVGSLHEKDDERGLAHFVEHMAFRGTREYPNGKMAETLQRLGIAFGPDSTAFTSFVHTIYHVEAPVAQASTIQVALHALREYATDITFEPTLIERERGVVLSEMATRDTPEARAGDFNIGLLWPKAREVRRKVIGDPQQIRSFQWDQFVAFYNAWYRPERLALIVVGDIDAAAMERMITAEFGAIKARAPARPDPADLVTTEAAPPNVVVFRDPGAVGLWLTLEHARRVPRQRDTHADRVRRLHEALAFSMFALRLRQAASQPNAVIVSPMASVSSGLDGWEVATVAVNGRINDWRAVTSELEMQQRTAVQYGFTHAEFEEARAAMALNLEQARRSAATRPSPALAYQLVGTLLNGTVFSTPEALQRDLAPELARTQLSDCRKAFRAAWLPRPPTVLVVTNSAFAITNTEMAAALNRSQETPVTRPTDVPAPEFAYRSFGPSGRLVREDRLPDLDVRLTEFSNGVRLNFKATTFEADGVEVRVRIGNGRLSQLKSRPGLDLLGNAAFTSGGVGRHTEQELSDILAGHAVQLSFRIDSDACTFTAHCAARELDLVLRMIAAFITDPAYRPDAMRQARAEYGSIMANLAASPGGPLTMSALRDMLGNDGRFGIPNFEEFSARDLGELRAWLDPQLSQGPIETSIVGDVPWAQARDNVAATLGALAPRPPPVDGAPAVPAVFSPVGTAIKILPISRNIAQTAVAWYWPVPHHVDVPEERRCYLLAAVLGERLRIKLREELGATYAPMVAFVRTDGFANVNYFTFYAEVEPMRMRQVLDILTREAQSLAQKGPAADEFERARQPYIRAMTDDLRTNGYWGSTVLEDAQQRPSRIAAARNRAADIATITRAEIAALARLYLAPERAYKYGTAHEPAK